MSVLAKFYVTALQRDDNGIGHITLAPVVSGSKENEKFFKWTPTGTISLGIMNREATEYFEKGKEYYVRFQRADVIQLAETPSLQERKPDQII